MKEPSSSVPICSLFVPCSHPFSFLICNILFHFIFDSFNYVSDIAILRGTREVDFAPVKNKEGVDSPRTAKELYEKFWNK